MSRGAGPNLETLSSNKTPLQTPPRPHRNPSHSVDVYYDEGISRRTVLARKRPQTPTEPDVSDNAPID